MSIGACGRHDAQRVAAVAGRDHGHAVLLEHAGEREDVADVVVDHQHLAALQHRIRLMHVLEQAVLRLGSRVTRRCRKKAARSTSRSRVCTWRSVMPSQPCRARSTSRWASPSTSTGSRVELCRRLCTRARDVGDIAPRVRASTIRQSTSCAASAPFSVGRIVRRDDQVLARDRLHDAVALGRVGADHQHAPARPPDERQQVLQAFVEHVLGLDRLGDEAQRAGSRRRARARPRSRPRRSGCAASTGRASGDPSRASPPCRAARCRA